MSVAGVTTTMLNPATTGTTATRAAPPLRPAAPATSATPRPAESTNCTCGQSPCACAAPAALETEDQLELSPEALQDRELTEQEQAEVNKLKQREQEVRAHENAHLAAAGGHARGGAHYDYTTGPDGQRYITGGEVKIDTSPVPNDPQATIQKMQTIRQAALAPADPSAQDRRVAAKADAEIRQARAKLSEQQADQRKARAKEAQPPAARQHGNDARSADGARRDRGVTMRDGGTALDGGVPTGARSAAAADHARSAGEPAAAAYGPAMNPPAVHGTADDRANPAGAPAARGFVAGTARLAHPSAGRALDLIA